MTTPTYGIVFNRENYDPRPAQPSDLSVIGLVLPSDNAHAATFPLNEPVLFDSGDPAMIVKLGTGDLYKAVMAIDDQLADLQTSARIVAVRVANGADDAATMTNIIGSRTATTSAGNVGTGIYALLRAGTQLGVVPRIIGAPGYTWQTENGTPTVTVTKSADNAGNGTLTLATPAYNSSTVLAGVYRVVFTSESANGGHFEVYDPNGEFIDYGQVGTAFNNQIKFTIADGTVDFNIGDAFDVAVRGIRFANPVVAALPPVLSALLAHAIVGGPGTGRTNAVNWAEKIGSERIIGIDAWRRIQLDGVSMYDDGVAALMGIAARVDYLHGGYPFWSWSGQQVYGTLGLKQYYPFSLVDGATAAQSLLAVRIGVIVRGEAGVETAISSNGFVFAGVWNNGTDPIWWFYNKTRGRDWAHLALLKSIRLRLGVENITPHSVQAVLNDMVAIGQDLIRNNCSVGFNVGFEASKNSPDDLRQGKFRVFFATEEPAPITRVWIDSRPNYEALVAELGTLVAQAATLPAIYLQ